MPRARSAALLAALLTALAWLVAASPAGAVSGQQRVLVVLATWGPEPFSSRNVRKAFDRADAFLRRSSFGQVRLTGDVTGWHDVLAAPVGCPADWWGGIPRSVAEPARAAAGSDGFRVAGYDRFVYVVPRSVCVFQGSGWEPEVLINGPLSAYLLVHELGHTWGLAHARSTDGVLLRSLSEDGDFYSPMGDGFTDFSTYEKTKLGWVTNVARAVKPGAYTIRRSDRRGRRPAALRVDAPSGQQYWFEYRPRRLAHEGRIVPGGLVVRVVDDRYAIPPLATPPVLVLDPNGRGRPTLRPGERFRVPGGFTIRVGKTAGDLVSLHVSLTSRTAVLHVGAR